MRVEVYRNLHTGLMSVRECNARVIEHAAEVFMRDVKFVVQPAGRAKVIREQRKNVHAFVRGELRGFSKGSNLGYDDWPAWRQVAYNPYKTDCFVDRDTGKPVLFAAKAVVTTKGVFYAGT